MNDVILKKFFEIDRLQRSWWILHTPEHDKIP